MTAHSAKHLYHLVGMPESSCLYVGSAARLLGVSDERVCQLVTDCGLDALPSDDSPCGRIDGTYALPRQTILALAGHVATPAAKLLTDAITAQPSIVAQRDLFRLQAKLDLARLLVLGTDGRLAFADVARMLGTTTADLWKTTRAEGLALDYPPQPAGAVPRLETPLTALVSLEAAQFLVRAVHTPEASAIFDCLWDAPEARRVPPGRGGVLNNLGGRQMDKGNAAQVSDTQIVPYEGLEQFGAEFEPTGGPGEECLVTLGDGIFRFWSIDLDTRELMCKCVERLGVAPGAAPTPEQIQELVDAWTGTRAPSATAFLRFVRAATAASAVPLKD